MDAAIMDLYIEQINQVTTVEIVGELDSTTAPEAQAKILPLAEKGSKIILDMSNVTYMSSAGLRTLLVLYRRANENISRIVLAGVTEEVREIMSLTGFLDHFQIAENRNEALRALAS